MIAQCPNVFASRNHDPDPPKPRFERHPMSVNLQWPAPDWHFLIVHSMHPLLDIARSQQPNVSLAVLHSAHGLKNSHFVVFGGSHLRNCTFWSLCLGICLTCLHWSWDECGVICQMASACRSCVSRKCEPPWMETPVEWMMHKLMLSKWVGRWQAWKLAFQLAIWVKEIPSS